MTYCKSFSNKIYDNYCYIMDTIIDTFEELTDDFEYQEKKKFDIENQSLIIKKYN